MGLFQDLPLTVPATKNPFDESFRKAVIDPDVSNNVLASILYVFGIPVTYAGKRFKHIQSPQ